MTNRQFKAIRKRAGLTQAALAAELGYHGAMAISVYERNTHPRPVPDHLAIIMRAVDAFGPPSTWPEPKK